MKRLLFAGLVLLAATPVFAINTALLHRGDRIGVLRMSERFEGSEQTVANAIEGVLPRALHDRGFDAFDAQRTFEDLRGGDAPPAAFYVEVVGAHAGGREAAGIGIGTENAGATLGVLVSRVAAEVRLYDGKTLELVDRWDLSKKSTMVAPTSIGIGGRYFWAALALPIFHAGQYRSAARDVAQQAAERIAEAARQ
jgi:hypothetical protein